MQKQILSFVKATTLGGLLILLPVVLIVRLLAEAMDLAIAVATPIADLFPQGTLDDSKFPRLLAVGLIVVTAFVLGLLARCKPGRWMGLWIERGLLLPLPGYRAIKSLTRSLGNPEQAEGFKPALLVSADGQKELAYRIEDHGDGQATVMLPWAPTSMAGSVKIVKRDQVELLSVGLAEITQVLTHWGVGTRAALHPQHASGKRENPQTES